MKIRKLSIPRDSINKTIENRAKIDKYQ